MGLHNSSPERIRLKNELKQRKHWPNDLFPRRTFGLLCKRFVTTKPYKSKLFALGSVLLHVYEWHTYFVAVALRYLESSVTQHVNFCEVRADFSGGGGLEKARKKSILGSLSGGFQGILLLHSVA